MTEKQDGMVNKMKDAMSAKQPAYFPEDFYSQSEVLDALKFMDLKNINVNIKFKNSKNFNSYCIKFFTNK